MLSRITCQVLAFLVPFALSLPSGQEILHGHTLNSEDVIDKLKKAEIIPTVVYDFTPTLDLVVSWKSDSASLGNTLNPDDLQHPPSVHLETFGSTKTTESNNVTRVLALTDPDAPSRDNPKWSQFCHWIATSNSNTMDLDDTIEYKPPGPPPKTGKHRYVFLVYVPVNGTTEKLHLSKPKDRKHWGSEEEGYGVREWAIENGLVPIAANFIYAQNKKQ